jgi:shikimate kinase
MSDVGSAPGRVVLIGMAGSGKTTVARLLARRLGGRFLDTDESIAARSGRPVGRIFAEDGEAEFRRVEAEVLAGALESEPHMVVATGGGVVTTEAGRELLCGASVRGWTVVWLRTDASALIERVGGSDTRPLLAGDAPAAVRRLLAEREDLYLQCSGAVVDTSGRSPAEVTESVLATLRAANGTSAGTEPDTM